MKHKSKLLYVTSKTGQFIQTVGLIVGCRDADQRSSLYTLRTL